MMRFFSTAVIFLALAALMHHATCEADSTMATLQAENSALKQAIAAFKRLPTFQAHKEAFMRDITKPQTTICRANSLRDAGQGICESRETLIQLTGDSNGDSAVHAEVHDAQATAQSPQETAALQAFNATDDGGSQGQFTAQHGGISFDDLLAHGGAQADNCAVVESEDPSRFKGPSCCPCDGTNCHPNYKCANNQKVKRCEKIMLGYTVVKYQKLKQYMTGPKEGTPCIDEGPESDYYDQFKCIDVDTNVLEKVRKLRLTRDHQLHSDDRKWTPDTPFLNSDASEAQCYQEAMSCSALDAMVEGMDAGIDNGQRMSPAKKPGCSLGVIDLVLTKTLKPRDCTTEEKKKNKGVGKCQAFEVKKKCELRFPEKEQHKITDMFMRGGIKEECSIL